MSFKPLSALGYSSSPVTFLNEEEVAWVCGNVLVIHNALSGTQRLLRGSSFGIQTLAACREHGLIAVVDKGYNAVVNVYSAADLGQLGSVNLHYDLGYSAIAFSSDGERLAICGDAPNNTLVIVNWRTSEVIVEATLPKPVRMVSFHPYDSNLIATTGDGLQHVWRLEKLWDHFDFLPKPVELGGSYEPSCHAWFSKVLYSGTSTGELFAVDLATMQPFAAVTPTPGAQEDAEGESGTDASLAVREASSSAASMLKVFDSGAPVLCITSNRDLVAVGGAEPTVVMYSHAAPAHTPMGPNSIPVTPRTNQGAGFEWRYEHSLGVAGVQALDFGGQGYSDLATGTLDGIVGLIHLAMTPGAATHTFGDKSSRPMDVLVDAHVGAVTGLCPHMCDEKVLSCGMDGSLRVWDMHSRQPVAKRTFSSAQTCLAVSRARALVAVGSETGVVRLVSTNAAGGAQPLQVTWRRRVHSTAVHSIAFSPEGDWVVSAGKDNSIAFSALNSDGTALIVGYVSCPEPILCLSWPEVEMEHTVLVSLSSGAIMALTLSEMAASHKSPTTAPGMQLLPKDYTIKVLKIETPIMKMTSLVGERYGEVIGLGADKHLHKIVLPVDSSQWLGLKGRALKSGSKVAIHQRSNGAISLSYNNQMLLTASADGHSCTLTPGLLVIGTSVGGEQTPAAAGLEERPGLHNVGMGGCVAAAFDASCRHFMTAGLDGSLFLYETFGDSHLTTKGYKYRRLVTVPAMDMDAFDEMSEITEAESHKANAPPPEAAAAAADAAAPGAGPHAPPGPPPDKGGLSVTQRLDTLRRRLGQVLARNEKAPELEKVDWSAFIIFRDLVKELKASADQRVEQVHGAVRKEHLTLELVTERVRQTCWDELHERGEGITGMRKSLTVHNFPLSKYNDKKLKQITALRRVEMMEMHQIEWAQREQAKQQAEADKQNPQNLHASQSTKQPTTSSATAPGADAKESVAPKAEVDEGPHDDLELSMPKASAGSWQSEAVSELSELLYPDMQLYGQLRKRSQTELLRRQVHNLKVEFNYEFIAVSKQKVSESDKLVELNLRIAETLHDLAKLSVSIPKEERFEATFPEDMVHVLTVRDEEVNIDRTAAEKLKKQLLAKAATAAHEAGGGAAAAVATNDDGAASGLDTAVMGERALRQMMGGTLEGKEELDTEFTLLRPEWMDSNPKLFTEQQVKEYKEFQIREKILLEEKAKRVAVLEAELRSLKGAVDDTTAKFDDALNALQAKKMLSRAEVAFCESRIIDITSNMAACAETGDLAEKELYNRLSSSKEAANRVIAMLSDKCAILADLGAKTVELGIEEKQLDRNFKKEFIETESLYPKLLQLYRLRTSASADEEGVSTQPPASKSVSRSGSLFATAARAPVVEGVLPNLNSKHETLMRNMANRTLDPFPALLPVITVAPSEEPELLDDSYRPELLDLEWWQRFVSYRAQKVSAEAKMKTLSASMALLHKELPRLSSAETQLTGESDGAMIALKSLRNARRMALYDGSLQLRLKAGQVEAEPPQPSSSDMSAAIFINRSVVEGVNSVVHTKGSKKVELLTAIKDFKKGIYQLEWEHKQGDMMISELREKTRELQLLHVTRGMQAVFKDGEDHSTVNESVNLEALSKQRERLHKKALSEKLKTMRKIAKLMDQKQSQNRDVSSHLVTLEKVLYEQERLRHSMQSVDEQVTRRMRSLVTHKRLKEIAEAQAGEVAALAAELDKLRLRTYPTFVEHNHMQVPPDLDASCFTGGSSWHK